MEKLNIINRETGLPRPRSEWTRSDLRPDKRWYPNLDDLDELNNEKMDIRDLGGMHWMAFENRLVKDLEARGVPAIRMGDSFKPATLDKARKRQGVRNSSGRN